MELARVRRDVISVFAIFALNGAMIGTWVSRIPAVKYHLNVGLDQLGWLFLMMGLGSLVSMPFTGLVVNRLGARTTHMICAVGAGTMLTASAFITNPLMFAVSYAAVGLFWGAWDVTINVQGAAVEAASGRTIMPSLHGAWGGGMMLGALTGLVATHWQVSLGTHMLTVLPVVAAVAIVMGWRWQDYRTAEPVDTAAGPQRIPRSVVLGTVVIGLMMLSSTIGEGSASDWLALHMVEDRGESTFIGASTYVVYALFLTVGRLGGHLLINAVGRVMAIRISGMATFVGVLAVIFAPNLAVSYLGAALWGIGLAAIFPAGISAAGEKGGRASSHTIAWASTLAYGGFLIGPPLLGILGEHYTLRMAFWVPALLAVLTILLAPSARPPDGASTPDWPGPGTDVPSEALAVEQIAEGP